MALPERRPWQIISTIISPIAVGTLQSGQVTASIVSGVITSVGSIVAPLTASIESGVITSVGSIVAPVTASIESGVITSVGSIVSAVTATIESGVLQYVATIGTILFANISVPPITAIATIAYIGTLNAIATLSYVGTVEGVGTLGTVQSLANLAVASLIGSIASGYITTQQAFGQTNILTNQVVLSGTAVASTLLAGTLQDLEVDSVYGTVVSGSLQSAVFGLEPQSNVRTSTIVSGDWFTGTIQTGQRIIALGPLGAKFVVGLNIGATSTILGVYLPAVQTTSS